MASSRVTFAIGLTASVVAHLALLASLRHFAGKPPAVAVRRPPTTVATLTILPDPTPSKKPPEVEFGEAGGQGQAINASAGDAPQAGPRVLDDQAAATRDPAGEVPKPPAPPPKPPTPPSVEPKALAESVVAPPPGAPPTPPPSPLQAFRSPAKPTPETPPPKKPPAEQKPDTTDSPDRKPGDAKPAEPKPQTPRPDTPKPEASKPTPPTPPVPAAGTPLPPSDRDSDPFSRENAPEFRRGRVVAKSGRQFKFARADFNLAAAIDTAEIALPAVIKLHIAVDAAGHPRKVDVVGSSGSRGIDRAFLLAAYASWFEPAKDAAGRPIEDDFDFPILLPR